MRCFKPLWIKRLLLAAGMVGVFVIPALAEGSVQAETTPDFPRWLSILPPLIAIGGALLFREVISALALGVLSGLLILVISSSEPAWTAVTGFAEIIQESAIDSGHMAIILFSLFVGGMVQLISKNGGMSAIVQFFSKKATDARSGQLATWFLGMFIFFDDYANTMVVGNTMRPVTDKLKISREKLAYIVDSTAAPIAATAFVTTWIGQELEYIQQGIDKIPAVKEMGYSAYSLFLDSLKYSFYPFLTLLFMLFLILRRRDFGPMLRSEKQARTETETERERESESESESAGVEEKVTKERAYNALIPIFILIFGTIAGLIYTGSQADFVRDPSAGFFQHLSDIIGRADSYKALLWSSTFTLIVSVLLTSAQRIMPLGKCIDVIFDGFKHMLPAIGILVLAWALGSVTDKVGTAKYVSQILTDSVSPYMIPSLTFILAALIALSTGSSWGTMAILYPVVLITSWEIGVASGLEMGQNLAILSNSIACVLAGSVLGDHCSPISDTTILSSISTQCDHIQHVRTQMPYALTVGGVSVLAGTTLTAYGVPWYACFALSGLMLYGIVSYFGKMAD